MLLDFHLAHEPLAAGSVDTDGLGGTPAYMSPEQKAALAAIAQGKAIPSAVDARSDVYSLGVLLYEALAGALPPTDQPATAFAAPIPRSARGWRHCSLDVFLPTQRTVIPVRLPWLPTCNGISRIARCAAFPIAAGSNSGRSGADADPR